MTQSALKISPKYIFSTIIILAGVAAFYLTRPAHDANMAREGVHTSLIKQLIVHETPKALPAFTLAQNGKKVALTDYAGKVIVLNYWATWCAPCRAEMPTLQALQAHYEAQNSGQNVQIVTVSIDRGAISKPQDFLRELGASDLVLWHDPKGKTARALGAYALPTTLVIDPQGREAARLLGAADWNSPPVHNLITRLLN